MAVGQAAAGGPGGWMLGRVLDPLLATDPRGHDLPAAQHVRRPDLARRPGHRPGPRRWDPDHLGRGVRAGPDPARLAGAALGPGDARRRDPRPVPAPARGVAVAAGRVLASDPATWKDLAYLVVLFPLGVVWFVVTLTLWTTAVGLLTAPLWYWIPADGARPWSSTATKGLVVDTLPEASWPRRRRGPVRGRRLGGQGHGGRPRRDRPGPARPQRQPAAGPGRGPPGQPGPGRRLGRGRAPPDRARPPRRRPAAPGRPGHGPGDGQGQAGDGPGGGHRPGRRGPRGGQAGPGRAARPGPRHPPGGAGRPRP